MSLDTFNVTRPGIRNQQSTTNTDEMANIQEEYTGLVETEATRRSVLKDFIPVRSVKGTSTLTNYSVGGTTLQRLTPGVTPDGGEADVSKIAVVVDSVILARNVIPLLDEFQQVFDARRAVSEQQGKKMAKFVDQAFFIQAAKAAMMTTNPYGTADFHGGSQVVLDAGQAATDPAVIESALANLLAQMEEKDVDPQTDDLMIALRPDIFYNFIQSEHVINGQYLTSQGNKIDGMVFKSFGVPVIRSNNVPNSVITNHMMSTARNGNAYDGDFSRLAALAFSPRALLAGETIPLQSKIFFDDVSKHWYVDTWTSFAVTPNRPEYAGAVLLPE